MNEYRICMAVYKWELDEFGSWIGMGLYGWEYGFMATGTVRSGSGGEDKMIPQKTLKEILRGQCVVLGQS